MTSVFPVETLGVLRMIVDIPVFPGWEAWLDIISNNEPLEVGEGGSFMMK